MPAKFEYFRVGPKYYFNLVAPNGEVIASGQQYGSKPSMMKGIRSIKRNAAKAKVVKR